MSQPEPNQPNKASIPARIGMFVIRGYQLFFSALWPNTCRFEPSCSAYGMEALKTHGLIKGSGLAIWRILRCNPWNDGGYDPVPHTHEHCDGTCQGETQADTARHLT